jgi:hypothetical protein
MLTRDPLADVRTLAGGEHLACVIKDGRIVDLGDRAGADHPIAFRHARTAATGSAT